VSRGVALIVHSLRRVRTLVLVMGLLLFLFQVFLVLVARYLHRSGNFERIALLIPDFVRQVVGPSMSGAFSFGGMACLGYFHAAVIGALTALAIALATEPAGEVESRFLDLVLARPLARHWVVTRSIAVVALSTSFLMTMMVLGTWCGLFWLTPEGAAPPAPGLVASLALNLGLLVLSWGGVALCIASSARRRALAGGLAGLLALACLFLELIARAWAPAAPAGPLTPFHYYEPFDLLVGRPLPVVNLLVLVGIALVGFALSYVTFGRRDI